MKLDPHSVKAIMGDSQNALVYGFESCYYEEVVTLLSENYNAGKFYAVDAPMIKFDKYDDLGEMERECKAAITSLVLDNYKRSLHKLPITPLIFCVSKSENGEQFEMNIAQVANRSGEISSVTDKELRRCYKVFAELSPEIRAIAEQTFKFVNLRQNDKEQDVYHLDPIEPFWKKPEWQGLWQKRQANKQPSSKRKKFFWRETIKSECKLFDKKRYEPAVSQPDMFFESRACIYR